MQQLFSDYRRNLCTGWGLNQMNNKAFHDNQILLILFLDFIMITFIWVYGNYASLIGGELVFMSNGLK